MDSDFGGKCTSPSSGQVTCSGCGDLVCVFYYGTPVHHLLFDMGGGKMEIRSDSWFPRGSSDFLKSP
jgi:hypothetical protein